MINVPAGNGVDVFALAVALAITMSAATRQSALPASTRIRAPRKSVDEHAELLVSRGVGHEHGATRARPIRPKVDVEHQRGVLRDESTAGDVDRRAAVP